MFVIKKWDKNFCIKKSKIIKKKLKCPLKIRNQIVAKLKKLNCDRHRSTTLVFTRLISFFYWNKTEEKTDFRKKKKTL